MIIFTSIKGTYNFIFKICSIISRNTTINIYGMYIVDGFLPE